MTEDNWYATGDYGFLSDGELYVIGHSKDIVIVEQQTVFPEDVEAVANAIEGISLACAVRIGVQDDQQGTERTWL